MKVVLTEEAEQDLQESVSYLLERNPQAAAALIDKVFDLAQRPADGMFDGPWEQLSDGRRVQSWPLAPYRLFYRRSEQVLTVLRVYHHLVLTSPSERWHWVPKGPMISIVRRGDSNPHSVDHWIRRAPKSGAKAGAYNTDRAREGANR